MSGTPYFSAKTGQFINNLPELLTICIIFWVKIWFFSIYINTFAYCLIKKIYIMNKTELIAEMADKAGLTKADAKKALDAFIDTTAASLKKGDKISLVGFGSFDVAKRNARTGRNPKTGEPIKIAAKKVVKFRPGSDLSNNVK